MQPRQEEQQSCRLHITTAHTEDGIMYVGFPVIDSWKIIHILQSCHQRSAFLDAETIVVDFSTKDEHNALLHKVFTRQMDWFVDYSAVDSMNNQSNFLKAEMFQRLQWEDFLFPLLCFYIIVNLISLSFGLLAEGKKKKKASQSQSSWLWLVLSAFRWNFKDQTITPQIKK